MPVNLAPGFYWLIEEDEKPTIVEIDHDEVYFIDYESGDYLQQQRYEKAKFVGPLEAPI